MEPENTMALEFASSLTDIREANKSFDYGVLRIAYIGENVNRSYISRNAFVSALPSIKNCPIVAHYTYDDADGFDDGEIGGHDMARVHDKDGNPRIVNLTEPLGVVPESAEQWFDDVEEEDGTTHTYLYTEVLLWKRQAVYSKIKNDGITGHSMEINVNNGFKKDGIFHIEDFEFTAFCLLGDDVQPCFESSAIALYSASDLKKEISEMMQELKESFSQVTTSDDVDNIHPQKNMTEGGNKILNEKMELLAKYGLEAENLDFSIEDFTVEELIEKFEAIKAESEQEQNPEDESNQNFSLTGQVVEEIHRQLNEQKYDAPWGETSRYCYIDCDFEASEVFAYDEMDWLVYGFNYVQDGDAIKIDFDSKKRKKFSIVDFDEGEEESPLAPVFADITKVIEAGAEIETKYNEVSEKFSAMETELEELKQFKADAEKAEADGKRNELFSKFEDLNGIEAFETLKENCEDMDLDALRKECFAIRGEFGMTAKFTADDKEPTPKLRVERDENLEKAPYGGLVEKYNK